MAFDGVGDFVDFIVDESEVRDEVLGGVAITTISRHFEE